MIIKKLISLLFVVFLFQNGIAQEDEKISTYEYYKASGELAYRAKEADEILGYIYMDNTFTKTKRYSNYCKVISKRKDGSKIYEGKLENGLWSGLWTYYYPNGNPMFRGEYLGGIIQKDFTVYYSNGKIKEVDEYNNGKKENSCEFSKNGDTAFVAYYDKGVLVFSKKYLDDKIEERTFKSFLGKNCDILIKNKEGKSLMLGHYYNQYAVGRWTFLDENGLILKQFMFSLKDSIKISDDILFNNNWTPDSNSISKPSQEKRQNTDDFKFISMATHYPSYSRFHNLAGRILIRFEISETGKREFIVPINDGSQGELTNAAIRVVQYLPNFRIGELNGKPIRISYVLPIAFSLDDM